MNSATNKEKKISPTSYLTGAFAFAVFILIGLFSANTLRLTKEFGVDPNNIFVKIFSLPVCIGLGVLMGTGLMAKDKFMEKSKVLSANLVFFLFLIVFGLLMIKVLHFPTYSAGPAELSTMEP